MVNQDDDGFFDSNPHVEHDNCGFGVIVALDGTSSHEMVRRSGEMLEQLEHRGGVASDGTTGDGAGIQINLPKKYFRQILAESGVDTSADDFAVGNFFLPKDPGSLSEVKEIIEKRIREKFGIQGNDAKNFAVWHQVPFDKNAISAHAEKSRPAMWEIIFSKPSGMGENDFENALYDCRMEIEKASEERLKAKVADVTDKKQRIKILSEEEIYPVSFSDKVYILKGLLRSDQLWPAFRVILENPLVETMLAFIHRRFATGASPNWKLAHPHGMVGSIHNGEMNTEGKNIKHRRELAVARGMNPFMGNMRGLGDSAKFDLTMGHRIRHEGVSVAKALAQQMIQAFQNDKDLSANERAMLEYWSLESPGWEGPGAVATTDGRYVAVKQDSLGLRPNHLITINENGKKFMMIGSEKTYRGPRTNVESRIMLGAGKMIVIDTETAKIKDHRQMLAEFATEKDYVSLMGARVQSLEKKELTPKNIKVSESANGLTLVQRQIANGWHAETIEKSVFSHAHFGVEKPHSLGDDVALPGLSNTPAVISDYERQSFVEVTAPPMDPITSSASMNRLTYLGAHTDLNGSPGHSIRLQDPVLQYGDLEQVKGLSGYKIAEIDCTFDVTKETLEDAVTRIRTEAERLTRDGNTIIILSDRNISKERQAVPASFAVLAAHKHLHEQGLRLNTSLVADLGIQDTHQASMLICDGADAINPYLMYDSAIDLHGMAMPHKWMGINNDVHAAYKKQSIEKVMENVHHGLLKGIETAVGRIGYPSTRNYQGSYARDLFGLDLNPEREPTLCWLFGGAKSDLGGNGLGIIEDDTKFFHDTALDAKINKQLPDRAIYDERRKPGASEHRLRKPVVVAGISRMRKAAPENAPVLKFETNSDGTYIYSHETIDNHKPTSAFSALQNDLEKRDESQPVNLKQFFTVVYNARNSIPVSEVQNLSEMLEILSTAPMSHGALTAAFHKDIARAMNWLTNPETGVGPRSNAGEGGYDWKRIVREKGMALNKVLQIASGRFGLEAITMALMEELEIKMAQGAKPGEGGQLEGPKATEEIVAIRGGLPKNQLISPPPQHDLYSIEDLRFLCRTLAEFGVPVSVKVVPTDVDSSANERGGFSSIVQGVAKCLTQANVKDPVITIAGNEGGTGAAKPTSLKKAGMTMEQGLRDAINTLNAGGYRNKGSSNYVKLRVSGGILTADDILKSLILGADEIDIGTGVLISNGCVVRRVCQVGDDKVVNGIEHKGCPVGLTGNEVKYEGSPEYIAEYTLGIFAELREKMARLGVKTLDELRDRTEFLEIIGNEQERMFRDILTAMGAPTPRQIQSDPSEFDPAQFVSKFDVVKGKDDVKKLFTEMQINSVDDLKKAVLGLDLSKVHENIRGNINLAQLTETAPKNVPDKIEPMKQSGLPAKKAMAEHTKQVLRYMETKGKDGVAPGTPSEVIEVNNEDVSLGTANSMEVVREYLKPLTEDDLEVGAKNGYGNVATHPMWCELPRYQKGIDGRIIFDPNEAPVYEKGTFPDDTFVHEFRGDAGQHFAAFIGQGQTVILTGTAHSDLGVGMGDGSVLVVKQDEHLKENAHLHNVADNTAFYGATGGKAFINGRLGVRAGERTSKSFSFVCEGMDEYGLEYATNTTCVSLGDVGNNFGAKMLGGMAFLYSGDQNYDPASKCSDAVRPRRLTGDNEDDKIFHEIIRGFVQEHADRTGSVRAKKILANWEVEKHNFTQVVPKAMDQYQSYEQLASLKRTFMLADGKVTPSMVTEVLRRSYAEHAQFANEFSQLFNKRGVTVTKDRKFRIDVAQQPDEERADYAARCQRMSELLSERLYHLAKTRSVHNNDVLGNWPQVKLKGKTSHTIEVNRSLGEVKRLLESCVERNGGKQDPISHRA